MARPGPKRDRRRFNTLRCGISEECRRNGAVRLHAGAKRLRDGGNRTWNCL